MKTKPKTHKTPSSVTFAAKLKSAGIELAPRTIREYWQRNAPKDVAGFIAWHSEMSAATNLELEALRKEKLVREIEVLKQREITEKRRNEVEAGELVKLSDVVADTSKIANKLAAVLRTKFETELPPKQDGMPAAEIMEMNKRALDQCFRILSESDFA